MTHGSARPARRSRPGSAGCARGSRTPSIDALLVTKLANVRYLTGFTGSAAMLLVAPRRRVVRHRRSLHRAVRSSEQLGSRVRRRERGPHRDRPHRRRAARRRSRRGRARHAARARGAQRHVGASSAASSPTFAGVELVPAGALVEELRRVKDAARSTASAARARSPTTRSRRCCPASPTGSPSAQFALALEFAMRERGASGNSFDPIIAPGPNGAKPHTRPSDRVIGRNELVVCDFGCIVDGYCSDMTRTVSVGDPGPDARHLYDVVLASQQAGRALVAADVACADVDRASRDVIADAGWADAFSHSTGHGVGLEIHEAPRVAATAGDTLLVGDVVTVEPGVYLPGIGGVRIEDTVVVAATGSEPLTLTPKDLVL